MYFFICIIFFIISIVLTIKYKFPQFKVFKEIFKKGNNKSFQTLFVSMASHIGTGNLVGITTGIIIAGPGFLFWMWIYAFFSSIFSFIENKYAVIYQTVVNDECYSGAPYYIRKGLNNKVLSIIFAFGILIINLFIFPPFQINAITISIKYILDIPNIYIGLFLLLIFILFVYPGTKSLVKLTNFIVPIMSILYLVVNIFIIIYNIEYLPKTLLNIVSSATNIKTFGISTIIFAFTTGVKRSIFSNEAGLGTTPSIAGMEQGVNSTTQGYFQMFGVYVDTLILCTLTGIFVVQTMMSKNIDLTNFQGPDLIIYLMNIYFEHVGVFLGIFFLICFAFSSVLGEFYLGENNLLFISNNKFFKIFYRIIFSIMLIFGVFFTTEQAMNLVDVGIIILGIINLIVILLLLKKDKWKLKM